MHAQSRGNGSASKVPFTHTHGLHHQHLCKRCLQQYVLYPSAGKAETGEPQSLLASQSR